MSEGTEKCVHGVITDNLKSCTICDEPVLEEGPDKSPEAALVDAVRKARNLGRFSVRVELSQLEPVLDQLFQLRGMVRLHIEDDTDSAPDITDLDRLRVVLSTDAGKAMMRKFVLDTVALGQTEPEEPEGPKPTVHILYNGAALCGFLAGTVPGEWPHSQTWIGLDRAQPAEKGLSWCPGCVAVRKMEPAVGPKRHKISQTEG